MESTTDAAEWKLEVERVLPQLKVTIRTDNKVSGVTVGITQLVKFFSLFFLPKNIVRHLYPL